MRRQVLGLNLPGLTLCLTCWSWLSANQGDPHVKKLMLGMRYGAVALLAAALLALVKPLAANPNATASLLGKPTIITAISIEKSSKVMYNYPLSPTI